MADIDELEGQKSSKIDCDHFWVSIHQPDLPIYWVAQCSICKEFDANHMQEQIDKLTANKVVEARIDELEQLHIQECSDVFYEERIVNRLKELKNG